MALIDRRLFAALFALSALSVIGASSSTARAQQVAKQVSSNERGHCTGPIWSADGLKLGYERFFYDEPRIDLFILSNLTSTPVETRVSPKVGAGDEKTKSTVKAFGGNTNPTDGAICRELSWGPPSHPNVFAYACNVEGASYQLFWRSEEKEIDQGERLTSGPGAAGQPAFSRSWQLAYVANPEGNKEGIFIVDDFANDFDSQRGLRRGAAVRLLPHAGRIDRVPTWDPVGKGIAFVGHSDTTGGDIYVVQNVKKAEETLTRLTDWVGEETNPSWSPDGTKIAFYSTKGSKESSATERKRDRLGSSMAGYDIWVADLKGEKPPFKLVTDVVASERRGPTWTPDSKYIVYVKHMQVKGAVNPVRAIEAKAGATEIKLKTGTNSNEDPAVVARGDEWWLAFTSIGPVTGPTQDWRRVYTFNISQLKTGAK